MSARFTAARLAAALEGRRDPADVLVALALSGPARDVRGGAPLADALARHDALPPAYVEALRANDPSAVRALCAAAASVERARLRFRSAAYGALGTLALVWLALGVGVRLALPLLVAPDQPAWWQALAAAFSAAYSPAGLAAGTAGLCLLSLAVEPIWRRSWPARRVDRAVACRGIAALARAGVPVERAIASTRAAATHPAVASGLDAAARRIDGGGSIGDALAEADLVPRSLAPMWRLADTATLVPLADALATTAEAEAAAAEPAVGRGWWLVYAVVAGAATIAFGSTMVYAWVEVLRWPA